MAKKKSAKATKAKSDTHTEAVFPIPVNVTPLPAPVVMTDCVLAISETFWQGTRIVGLLPDEGCELPAELKTGQRVRVQFLPVELPTSQDLHGEAG